MGYDGVCYGWVPMVWVCCGSRFGFAAVGYGDHGFFFFFFLVVLMVREGGILQIFSGGGWLVGSVVWVCGERWSGGQVCCFGFVVGGVY